MTSFPDPGARPAVRAFALGLAALVALGFAAREDDPAPMPWPVSEGAVAGYVPDVACAECHEALWDSYQDVAMAQAFKRVRADEMVEDFEDAHLFHEPSGNHYEMVIRDDEVWQRRYRLDAEGKEYAVLERRLDWIVGSGNHGRNYFFQTELGELYQLPVVWYSQEGHWGMAPGYDKPDHFDFSRRIGFRCMACHNAYPEVPEGSDRFGSLALFPRDLPEGIGCQRCHGPGGEHVRLANDLDATEEEIVAAIVNPTDLGPRAQEDLCSQCHLQPSTSIDSFLLRFDTPSYSFRPGMALEDYHLPLDIDEGAGSTERFEINHHSYRLMQSRCFTESEGALSCLTCHDPHRKVPPERRAAHYRKRCLGCHQPDTCSQEPMHASVAGVAADDCATCHMPMHRPREVVNVLMTDHRIRRELAPEDWAAPREERGLNVTSSGLYRPERIAGDPNEAIYHALAASKSGNVDAILRLRTVLTEQDCREVEAWMALGDDLFGIEARSEAVEAYRRAAELAPELDLPRARLGATLALVGEPAEGLEHLLAALELEPDRADTRRSAGRVLARLGRDAEALPHLSEAVRLRPHDYESRLELANLHARAGDWNKAVRGFRQAVAADPREPAGHDNLGLALSAQNKWPQALRAWERGLECVPDDLSLLRRTAELRLVATNTRLRSTPEALEHAARAVELDETDPLAALLHAVALLESGEPARALAEAERAGTFGADPTSWRLVAARAARDSGDRARAQALHRAADPSSTPATGERIHGHLRMRYARL